MRDSIFAMSYSIEKTQNFTKGKNLVVKRIYLGNEVVRQQSLQMMKRGVLRLKNARATLPANASNFTCVSQVNRPHTQLTFGTCSLFVKTRKITRVYAASTSRKIHANRLQPHEKLPEYNRYFTGNFTCGTHASLTVTSMQISLYMQAKIHAICRPKH